MIHERGAGASLVVRARRRGVLFVVVATLVAATGTGTATAGGGPLEVVSVEPSARALNVPVDARIVVRFDRPVAPDTIVAGESFWAFARESGVVTGPIALSDNDATVTLVPDHPLAAGELVTVILSHDIHGADGTPLRDAGYTFQFWTNARLSTLDLAEIDAMTTNVTPQLSSRPYGGVASDLNGDRYIDITIVNEDTEDLTVFLNLADGTGGYADFIQPTFPVGDRASPSEQADFNRDGIVDICVASINANIVSVLLGVGDGTYGPQQVIPVGNAPRGIATLDVDGDGDMDIVNTNAATGNMSLMINDGAGAFGPPGFFEGGGLGEWALAAADMNEDGVLDLVIGARDSQEILVNVGNGDATFTHVSSQDAGGRVWMLVCGDVNGDGHEDVSAVNSTGNVGAILLGDGQGNLAPPVTYATDPFPLATDLGDIDGDGDLDWITSSFGGDWFVFLNNGAGVFTFVQEINAPAAASCCLMLDIDNDGDLDLGLIDEIADLLIIVQNSGVAPTPGDMNGDCHIDTADYATMATCLAGPEVCAGSACLVFDFNDDCRVDMLDFMAFATRFTGPADTIPGCTP